MQHKGLGDTIAAITKVTGIEAAVKALFDDCGCDARQDKLNKLVPYGKSKEGSVKDVHGKAKG